MSSTTFSTGGRAPLFPFCCVLGNGMDKARSVKFKSTIRLQATTGESLRRIVRCSKNQCCQRQPRFSFLYFAVSPTQPPRTVIGFPANDLTLMRISYL
jgi:hypothetical protein